MAGQEKSGFGSRVCLAILLLGPKSKTAYRLEPKQ